VATVLDGIEDSLHIKLDRDNIIYLRMTYKGTPTATVIREKTNDVRYIIPRVIIQ
jgi:hypothetical protein